jgi:hypothetical protein
MAEIIDELVRQDLARRGLQYTLDSSSGRYAVQVGGTTLLLSVENLAREYRQEGDDACVARFLDSSLAVDPGVTTDWAEASKSVLFCLEPSDYVEGPEIRVSLSKQIDRVPTVVDEAKGRVTWISSRMLDQWGVSVRDVETTAMGNLAIAAASSSVEWQDIDGVRLGFLNTRLPFKSPVLLAPNFRSLVAEVIGWPLYAVVPDRDFVYIWAAKHIEFVEHVGAVVLEQYAASPYPLSTEVFEINDAGMEAIGAFAEPLSGESQPRS